MQQNIVFDISSENSSSSDEDEFIKMDQQNSSILSIRAPNLFDSDTPQEFQQIPEATQSLRKQHTVTFETLNTNEGERRQLNKWNLSEKENRNRNSFTITTEVTEKDRGNIKMQMKVLSIFKSRNLVNNNKLSPIHKNNPISQRESPMSTIHQLIISRINLWHRNYQNWIYLLLFHKLQIREESIITITIIVFIITIILSTIQIPTRPQMSQKQGCIVRQSFNKQGSQGDIPIVQQTRERSITMILRQPGKIVNQKQLKSNSIALRK